MSKNGISKSDKFASGAPQPAPARAFIMGTVAGVIAVLVLGLLVGLPLSLAHRAEFPLESAAGHLAVNLISSLSGGNAVNPLAKNDKTLTDGADLFANNCSSCHGKNGDGKGDFVNRYFPPAADLTAAGTQGKSDAQLRWIIKNGLSFTAMASYPEFDDDQLWSIVTYIRTLK
jgi:mono/diheme cytochrome c family protein